MGSLKGCFVALLLTALFATVVAGCGEGDSTSPSGANEGATQESTGGPGSQGTDEGQGSAREKSSQFRTAGDNSIQTFGREAGTAELAAAQAALSGYLEAREQGEVSAECGYLAESALSPLVEAISRAPQFEGKTDCQSILTMLTGRISPAARTNPMTAGVAAFRVEGERGFALFRGPGGIGYFVQMIEEDGEWKVGAIAPTELP